MKWRVTPNEVETKVEEDQDLIPPQPIDGVEVKDQKAIEVEADLKAPEKATEDQKQEVVASELEALVDKPEAKTDKAKEAEVSEINKLAAERGEVRGVDEANNVSPMQQEFIEAKEPKPKGVIPSTPKREVPLDGVLYSRTFTGREKLKMEPSDRTRPPLQEPNALNSVQHQTSDRPQPNNPPTYSSMEQSGTMPTREKTFMLRGKKVRNSSEYNPQKREGIIAHVKSIIGNRMYNNRIKDKTISGYYNTINGETRVRKYGDVETMAHEMAHYLDFYYKNLSSESGAPTINGQRIESEISKIYSLPEHESEVKSFSYTSDKNLEMTEGFAEYVRAWLTNFDYAKDRAPKFTIAFERYLNTDKKLKRQMLGLQVKMHRWYLQGDKARLIEGISGEAQLSKTLTPSERLMRLKSFEVGAEFKQGVFDYLHAAKVMSRSVKGGLTEGITEPYKLLQLLHGSEQIFAESYDRGAPYYKADGSLDFRGVSLDDVWGRSKKAGNERMKDQEAYFAARRAEEATRKGTEKLFTKGMIKEGLALGRKYPYFKQAFKDFQVFNKSMLQFYVDSGYITQDSMDAFTRNNEAYVAFHRAVHTRAEGKGVAGGNIGAKQTGAEESVLHIYQNTLKQTGIHIAAALKARAMRELYEQALPKSGVDAKNGGAQFITEATTDTKPITVDADQIAKTILQKGTENEMKVSDLGMVDGGVPVTTEKELVSYLNKNPDLLKFWTFGQPPKDRRTDFDSYIDREGKTKWVQINEDNTLLPSMLDALNGLHLPQNQYIKAALKIPIMVKNLKTVFITSAWQFAGGNIFRDSATAMALSNFKFKPVYSHLKGLAYMTESLWNANGLVGELRGNGGYSGGRTRSVMYENWGLTGSNTEYLSDKAWYRSPTRIAKEALLAYTKLADISEMMTRVGFYAEARASGVDPVEAAWQTRQITTDFQKRGANPQLAYTVRTAAFLNAGMQGFMREMEAIFEVHGEMKLSNFYKDEQGMITLASVKSKMYGAMMTIAGLSMMSAYLMLNSDDEEEREIYKNLTPDERSRFIHLPGGTKLPKPIGVFGFAAAMSEISINAHLDPKQTSEFVTDEALFAMGYHLVLKGSPAIMQLPLDFATGKDWKGAPIVPMQLEGVDDFEQYNPRTGLAYVELGKQLKDRFNISLSPIKAEYVVKNTLGYYAEYFKEYTDRLFWDYEKWGERPFQKNFSEISFRQFKKDERIYRNKYTSAYYDMYSEAMKVEKSISVAIQHMIESDSDSLEKNYSTYEHTFAALASAMGDVTKVYNEWQQGVILGNRDPNKTGKEKEQSEVERLKSKNKILEDSFQNFKRVLDAAKAEIKNLRED